MADRKPTVLNPAGYQENLQDTDNLVVEAAPTADNHATNKLFVDTEVAAAGKWSETSGVLHPKVATNDVWIGTYEDPTVKFTAATGNADFDGRINAEANVNTNATLAANNGSKFVNVSAVPFDGGTKIFGYFDGSSYTSSITPEGNFTAVGIGTFGNGKNILGDGYFRGQRNSTYSYVNTAFTTIGDVSFGTCPRNADGSAGSPNFYVTPGGAVTALGTVTGGGDYITYGVIGKAKGNTGGTAAVVGWNKESGGRNFLGYAYNNSSNTTFEVFENGSINTAGGYGSTGGGLSILSNGEVRTNGQVTTNSPTASTTSAFSAQTGGSEVASIKYDGSSKLDGKLELGNAVSSGYKNGFICDPLAAAGSYLQVYGDNSQTNPPFTVWNGDLNKQVFKAFANGNVEADGTITAPTFSGSFSGTATNATNVRVDSDNSTNATRYIAFADGGGGANQRIKVDSGFNFNPSTNTLTVTNLSGNASTASDSSQLNGYGSSSGADADTIARRDAGGNLNINYALCQWVQARTNADTSIGAQGGMVSWSTDGWYRHYDAANSQTVLDVPSRTGSGASGTWDIISKGVAIESLPSLP